MTHRGQLANYFSGVGVKRLSAVDAERAKSNQHEVGTTRNMRDDFLGAPQRQEFDTVYVWLGEEQDGFKVVSTATHYDSRINQPNKYPEWRLYYTKNDVTETMRRGNTLFLAKDRNEVLYFIVTPEGSTSEQQLSWLFGLHPQGELFVSRDYTKEGPELDFAARFILDELGIEFEEPDTDRLDRIIERFGTTYPLTAEFSDLARLTLPEVRAEDDPDLALLAWLDHEEAMFRRLERRIVALRLEKGFTNENGTDVDGFISYSLSVQNRRKSRMGYSLEHHVKAVFRAYDIDFDHDVETENKNKPDFLFPGLAAYLSAPASGATHLMMLGAKSTCKDRWRQVLAEAEKIPSKHLLTLEPSISESQTKQMEASSLQLVVPSLIQQSYTPNQQDWLWSLDEFISEVKMRQTTHK